MREGKNRIVNMRVRDRREGKEKSVCGIGRFVLLMVMLSSLLLSAYSKEETRVFDQAELLTEGEEEQLESQIVQLMEKTELDIIIVTTKDAQGKSSQEYADDFYDEGAFGSGVLLLIDMDNREVYISTAGQGIEEFTDQEIESILDDVYPYLSQGAYKQACMEFLDDVSYYGTNQNRAQNGYYNTDTNQFQSYTREELQANYRKAVIQSAFRGESIGIHLVISVIIGGAVVLIMVLQVRNSKSADGHAYVRPGSEHLLSRSDRMVNTTVVTRHIQNHPGGGRGGHGGPGGMGGGMSSTHTSHGGASHGGGGRRF
jgi:uncharacterized protein